MKTNFKVLVIDDAFFIRNLIKKSISKKPKKEINFEVIGEADNGEDGLNLCKTLKPDIITLDLHMPKKDGLEVIDILKETQPEIQIIVITSNKNKEIAENVLEKNCRFIQKPFQDHLLYKDLDEIAQIMSNREQPNQEKNKDPLVELTNKNQSKRKLAQNNQKKTTKKDSNFLAHQMNNSFMSVKTDDFSYFSDSDVKASNKKAGKIEEFMEEPILKETENTGIEEPILEELILEEKTMDEIDSDDILDFTESVSNKPQKLSLEKRDDFEEADEFDKIEDFEFIVEDTKLEDTISEDFKRRLEKGEKEIDFQDMDENSDEYIRFSKNDMGENNEYLELLMGMSYSYNMEIGYKLEQIERQKMIESSKEKELKSKLEELTDPNLHSILRNQQQEIANKIQQSKALEEKDEFDEFDDFTFDAGDNKIFDTVKEKPKLQNNGYTIAPPVKNRYEVDKVLKDSNVLKIQQPKPIDMEKKSGFFAKLLGKFFKKN